jgi:hypothetical protein
MNLKQTSFCSFLLEFKTGSVSINPNKLGGEDIKVYSLKNSPYLNYEENENSLVVANAGEHEIRDIFINSKKNKNEESFVYNIACEGVTIGVISFVNDISVIPEEFFETTDVLLIGAGGGPFFTVKDAYSLLNKLSPSIAIIFGFKEQANKDLQNTLDSLEDAKKEIGALSILDKSLKIDKDFVDGLDNTVYYAFGE